MHCSMIKRKTLMSLAKRLVVILSNIKMFSFDIAIKLDRHRDIIHDIFSVVVESYEFSQP